MNIKPVLPFLLILALFSCGPDSGMPVTLAPALDSCYWRDNPNDKDSVWYVNDGTERIEGEVIVFPTAFPGRWQAYVRGADYGPMISKTAAMKQVERIAAKINICTRTDNETRSNP